MSEGEKTRRGVLDDIPVDGSTIKVTSQTWVEQSPNAPGQGENVHCLAVIEGVDFGRRILLRAGRTIIGRALPVDVLISDHQISRRHCQLTLEDHVLTVSDLNSTNGSFVQNNKLSGPEVLAIGALLRVGRHVLRHEYRRRQEVEFEQAYWSASPDPAPDEPGPIEIDAVQRQSEVQRMLSSDFFRELTRDLDDLRRL